MNVPKVSCTNKALVLLIQPIVFDVLIAVLSRVFFSFLILCCPLSVR